MEMTAPLAVLARTVLMEVQEPQAVPGQMVTMARTALMEVQPPPRRNAND